MYKYQTIIDDIALQTFYQKPLNILHVDETISVARERFDELLSQDDHETYDAIRFLKVGINDKKLAHWKEFECAFADLRHQIMLGEINSGRPYFDAESPNVVMFNVHIDGFYSVDLNCCDSVYTRVFAEVMQDPKQQKVVCYHCKAERTLRDLTPMEFSSCSVCREHTPYFSSIINKQRDAIHERLRPKELYARSNRDYMRTHNPYVYLVSKRVGAIPDYMLKITTNKRVSAYNY